MIHALTSITDISLILTICSSSYLVPVSLHWRMGYIQYLSNTLKEQGKNIEQVQILQRYPQI